jgi:hypothetical protein
MRPEGLTDDLRRLIFSIPSIPHLEAMLLMRRSGEPWQPTRLAQRLYLSVERTTGILDDLVGARICRIEDDADPDPALLYRYAPFTAELDLLVGSLERYYGQNLIEVTNMIHASLRRHSRIQEFADAFKWDRKKP